MIDLGITAVANQTFFAQLEGASYAITLHAADDTVAATIVRDGVSIVTGGRITPGMPLLPYRYQEAGNFLLLTNEGDLPDYAQFGATQFLVYLTAAELAAARA